MLQQNADLKTRLNRVHDVSDLGDLSAVDAVSETVCFVNNCLSFLLQYILKYSAISTCNRA